jgi:hypothetical protein
MFNQAPTIQSTKRKQRFTKRIGLQVPRRRAPPPIPDEDPDEVYVNTL